MTDIKGIDAIGTALILGEVGDVRRFASKHHFASYTGTAPLDVSRGDQNRHRLNRGGNRRLNYALHVAALVQIRFPGPGQDYYARKRAEGKKPLDAMRCLKRRLSDVVLHAVQQDLQQRLQVAGPEGHSGRLFNPARLTQPRWSALRIIHLPDPPRTTLRAAEQGSRPPVDNREERYPRLFTVAT